MYRLCIPTVVCLFVATSTWAAETAPTADLAERLRRLDGRVILRGTVSRQPMAAMLSRHVAAELREANRLDRLAWSKVKTKADWERMRDRRIAALRESLGQLPAVPRNAVPKDLKVRVTRTTQGDLDHKIRVAAASDYVPGPYEPLMAIQSMVTRKDFEGRVWGLKQRITVKEALKVCTINGAYASFEEHTKGSITAGKLADFVILAPDPHAVEPDKIKHIKVVRTVVGGETAYAQA